MHPHRTWAVTSRLRSAYLSLVFSECVAWDVPGCTYSSRGFQIFLADLGNPGPVFRVHEAARRWSALMSTGVCPFARALHRHVSSRGGFVRSRSRACEWKCMPSLPFFVDCEIPVIIAGLVGRLASAPPPTSLGGAGGPSLGGGGGVSYLDSYLRSPADVGGGRDEMSSYLGSSLDSAFLNTVSSPYGGDGGSGVPQSPGFGSSSAGSSVPMFSRSLTPISSSSAFIPPSLASLSGNGSGGAGLGDRSSAASTCFFDPSGVGIAGSVVRRGSLSSSLRDDPTASNTDGLLTPGDDDPT